MCWDEVLAEAKKPTLAVALSAARMRILVRMKHAPPALRALLQIAGQAWKQLIISDLSELQLTLSPKLVELPSPAIDLTAWLSLAAEYPVQWKQLVKQFMSKKVQYHVVNWQLGYRCEHVIQAELDEEVCQCPECGKQLLKKRALEMHCKKDAWEKAGSKKVCGRTYLSVMWYRFYHSTSSYQSSYPRSARVHTSLATGYDIRVPTRFG